MDARIQKLRTAGVSSPVRQHLASERHTRVTDVVIEVKFYYVLNIITIGRHITIIIIIVSIGLKRA